MNDGENSLSKENFEKIPIDSLRVRGLKSAVIKALKNNGIKVIGNLKGKTSIEMQDVMGVDVLGEILYVIGIEYKLESEYFMQYSFISKENETIVKICENPLNAPISRLDCKLGIAQALVRKEPKILTVNDLIGRGVDKTLGSHGIGPGLGEELCLALQSHNVTVIDGKFHYNSRTDEYLVSAETGEPSDKSEKATDSIADEQLRQFLILSREVAELSPEAIAKVNAAISNIIKEDRGRGDDINV